MNIRWYTGKREELEADVRAALEMTGEAIRTDLVQRRVLPFAEDPKAVAERKTAAALAAGREPGRYASDVVPGELQGSVFVDRTRSGRGEVSVVTNTPYARRLYYHPEYNFYQGTNTRAGGLWYRPYIKGDRRAWVETAFSRLLRRVRSR